MKNKKILTLLMAILILCHVSTISVLAASGKAYIFTYVWEDANTRNAGSTTVLSHLWDMGYDAGEYLNNGATPIYSVMPGSKITAIVTHAGPGFMQVGTDANTSYLYAKATVSGNDRSISNLSASALSNTRLVLYVGCNSGNTASNGSNLVTATYGKGAQCVVGWKCTIGDAPASDWVRLLFEKANEDKEVLWECFNHADYWVGEIYGDYYENQMNSRKEAGNVSQYLYK